MPASKPVTFRDLPEAAFPFVIEFRKVADDEVVLRTEVTGPGVVEVPPLSKIFGPTWVRVTYANGEVVEDRPDEA